MLRSLFSVAAICSLLFVTLAAPSANASRRRCPDEPPSTVLSLFKKSDAIYIGKFDKSVDGEVIRTDENSQTLKISDHFSISTTIKGESRKFFVRNYDEYRYLGAEAESEGPEEEYEDEQALKAGDNVLLFLKFAEDEQPNKKGKRVLELAHYRDGVKRLDEAELSSYEARIKDLKGILSSKKVNDADVLNWIMRCIDDPVTRWEGAYELYSSFQTLEWKERSKEEQEASAEEPESDSHEEAEMPGEEVVDEEEEYDNSAYAKLLTDAQKARLADIAIGSKPAKSEDKPVAPRLRDGDRVLFDVVKRWGDSRLANAMLDRLRGLADDNYEKLNWMSSISEVLKAKELTAISEKFGDVTYQDDNEEVIESKVEVENEVIDVPADESETPDEPETETSEPSIEETSEVDTEAKVQKKTYKQYRDELVADFIGKASLLISQEKKADTK